jgi:hypothetical protein
MPAHTSHLLQTLNIRVFRPLKHAYRKLVKEMMIARNNYINKEDFLYLYPPACEAVFTQQNIYNSFTGAGLNLFNID